MQPGLVTALDADALDGLATGQLRDAIAATDPDVLATTSASARIRLRGTLDADLPVLCPDAAAPADEPMVHGLGDVDLVVASSDATLGALPALEADATIDPTTETYVLTDRLALSIRPTELATAREGVDAYRRAIAAGERDADRTLEGSYTHLSAELPAGYYGEWDGLTVRGVAPGELEGTPDGGAGGGDRPSVASLRLGPHGTVAAEEYRRDSLGLRAISGIGERRAATLREAGYPDRETLAEADAATVADLDRLGRRIAVRLVERARAFREGRVLRTGDGSLPGPEPVFVDVETDGLSPSVAWLIGVLDRDGGETYMSFLTRDPAEPGKALSAFCTWYAANAANRPIVAYNGRSFDVPVIADLVERYCPEHRDVWRSAWTFDPYAWAVSDGNAVLPGRTDQLDDVAEALGFDRGDVDGGGHSTGATLSGAEVARIYRQWQADPTPANEPEWERLEAYCEADVRALAHVYDALAAADRTAGETTDRSRIEETTQGSLGEF